MREEVSIAAFIAAANGRSRDQVRLDAEREKAEADRFTARTPLFRRGVPGGPSQETWRAYGNDLRAFLFFIYRGARPADAGQGFAEFRPIVESWVRSGEAPAAVLGAFDGASSA